MSQPATYTWYCSECGFGPHSVLYDVACNVCHHQRDISSIVEGGSSSRARKLPKELRDPRVRKETGSFRNILQGISPFIKVESIGAKNGKKLFNAQEGAADIDHGPTAALDRESPIEDAEVSPSMKNVDDANKESLAISQLRSSQKQSNAWRDASTEHHQDRQSSARRLPWQVAPTYYLNPPRNLSSPNSQISRLGRSSSIESLDSIPDSVFSIASGCSSTSSVSVANVAENAFQRVLGILKTDMFLADLYDELVTKYSSEKVSRNLGTLFKRFAVDLEKDASREDEIRIARFIRSRARRLAQNIVDSILSRLSFSDSSIGEHSLLPNLKELEDFENDDAEEDTDDLRDLEIFIINPDAFRQLRLNIQSLLRYQSGSHDTNPSNPNELPSLNPFGKEAELRVARSLLSRSLLPDAWHLNRLNLFCKRFVDILSPEPPIPDGMSRVRWECVSFPGRFQTNRLKIGLQACGEALYDDYFELKLGAAARMEEDLRQLNHRTRSPSDKVIGSKLGKAFQRILRSIQDVLASSRRTGEPVLVETELRYYSQGRSTRTPPPTSGDIFYLLMCHHDGIGAETTKLKQLDVSDVDTDNKLFQCLHDEYTLLRKRWWTWISLWSLQSIKFAKFELFGNDLVDIKSLDEVPPPAKKNEYRHGPPNPPELSPPLGSILLMNLFKHPELAGTRSKHCLNKIPRRLRERLAIIDEDYPPLGWGLQFVEGWSKKRLMYLAASTFSFASLVVIILVSVLGRNIQNAAAIASFMLSLITIAVTTLQAAIHMS
ncbi:hypothetical protein BDZ45DRAFT_743523 [Acephala macrosclerotiorum]|nr:hypothetical protein BDZ45DRAFT_743523 [Acephala macrosclerotiorum]